MFKTNKKRAFTLIELIVVMAVIGVLVLLAMPKFMGHTKEAKFTKLISDTKILEDASERYYMDRQDWPRLNDKPYTAEQVKAFAKKIYDTTGKEVTIDTNGNYYDIDYNKLSKYVNIPDNKESYIIQNPVGNVYALEGLTKEAQERVSEVKATSIILDATEINMVVGENKKLTATIQPANASMKIVKWISSDESIATIDNSGNITAIANGTVTITAKSWDGGVSTTVNVTITTGVAGITLDVTSFNLNVGANRTLVATIQPDTASNKVVIWTSSNPSVATVDNTGKVIGISNGVATITVKTVDGNFITSCNVTISPPFSFVQNFSYTGSYQTFTVPETGRYKLEVWGAQGGDSTTHASKGGKGGYSYGEINLVAGQNLYIYVGGAGKPSDGHGGWNGGGNGYGQPGGYDGTGGGATDIRTVVSSDPLNYSSLLSRIIVAGGGGGAEDGGNGGAGGGLVGIAGTPQSTSNQSVTPGGGSQTSGGVGGVSVAGNGSSGGFGYGGSNNLSSGATGGGGGWYGGGAGTPWGGSSGGSGYVGNLLNANTIAGNKSFNAPNGGTEIGHSGNGYAKITYISQQ